MKITFNLRKITGERFYPLYYNRTRHLHLVGGAGSGKSHFWAQKILWRIIVGVSRGVKHRFAVLRKTQPALRRSAFTLIRDKINSWGLGSVFELNKSEMLFTFMGSEIHFVGLDDPDKLKSIEGLTGIVCEEAEELTKEDTMQINLRLRGLPEKIYPQIIYAYNPANIGHHFYDSYHSQLPDDFTGGNVRDDVFIHRSTYRDNPFPDVEYNREIENLKDEDPAAYKIYGLGLYAAVKGIIYTNYEIVSRDLWPDQFDDGCYGLDFGFNAPSALVYLGVKDQEPWVRQEIYQSGLNNTDLISLMGELNIDKGKTIYADSAEPARIDEICQAGYICEGAKEAKKSVSDRIQFCKSRRLHIHEDSDMIIKERNVYKYKEKDGKLTEEPLKFMDHAMNAFEYAYFMLCHCSFSPGVFSIGKAGS